MKLLLLNTINGLVPIYGSDFDEKRKLRLGVEYECEIKNPRNYRFLKKFFALLNVGYENSQLDMPFDSYRKYVTMKAGFFKAYTTPRGTFYDAESIAFSAMSQDQFEDVYSRVLDVIIKDLGCTGEDIEEQIMSFT